MRYPMSRGIEEYLLFFSLYIELLSNFLIKLLSLKLSDIFGYVRSITKIIHLKTPQFLVHLDKQIEKDFLEFTDLEQART